MRRDRLASLFSLLERRAAGHKPYLLVCGLARHIDRQDQRQHRSDMRAGPTVGGAGWKGEGHAIGLICRGSLVAEKQLCDAVHGRFGGGSGWLAGSQNCSELSVDLTAGHISSPYTLIALIIHDAPFNRRRWGSRQSR